MRAHACARPSVRPSVRRPSVRLFLFVPVYAAFWEGPKIPVQYSSQTPQKIPKGPQRIQTSLKTNSPRLPNPQRLYRSPLKSTLIHLQLSDLRIPSALNKIFLNCQRSMTHTVLRSLPLDGIRHRQSPSLDRRHTPVTSKYPRFVGFFWGGETWASIVNTSFFCRGSTSYPTKRGYLEQGRLLGLIFGMVRPGSWQNRRSVAEVGVSLHKTNIQKHGTWEKG